MCLFILLLFVCVPAWACRRSYTLVYPVGITAALHHSLAELSWTCFFRNISVPSCNSWFFCLLPLGEDDYLLLWGDAACCFPMHEWQWRQLCQQRLSSQWLVAPGTSHLPTLIWVILHLWLVANSSANPAMLSLSPFAGFQFLGLQATFHTLCLTTGSLTSPNPQELILETLTLWLIPGHFLVFSIKRFSAETGKEKMRWHFYWFQLI